MTKKLKTKRSSDRAFRPYDRREILQKKANPHYKKNSFQWTVPEQILYLQFLNGNKTLQERKRNKVFVHMSTHLKTRNSQQCRSHHQKMSIKYGDIDDIIEKITIQKINQTTDKTEFTDRSCSIQNYEITEKQSNFEQIENDLQKEIAELQYLSSPGAQERQLWECVMNETWLNF